MSKMSRGSAALLTSVALLGVSAAAAQATTVIDNRGTEQSDGYLSNGSQTVGQTVTAPAGEGSLSSFSFDIVTDGTTTFRGEVYAWDSGANRPTGPAIAEVGPITANAPTLTPFTFETGSAPVVAGQKYVLFVSTLKDGRDPYTALRFRTADTYAGGDIAFVQYESTATFDDVLARTWNLYTPQDLSFRAQFDAGSPPVASGSGSSHVFTSFNFTVSGTKAAPAGSATFTDAKGSVRSGDVSCFNRVGKRLVFGIKDTAGGAARYREFYAEDKGASGDRLAELSGSQKFTTPPRQGCRTTLTSAIKGDAISSGDIAAP